MHIQKISRNLISLPENPPKPYQIGDVVKIAFISEWYDSIFENDEKMEKSLISVLH